MSYKLLWYTITLSVTLPLTPFATRSMHDVIYIFAHGLGGNRNQAYSYQKSTIIGDTVVSFNFPDVHETSLYNSKKVTLAQESDIQALKQAYIQARERYIKKASSYKGMVLLGVSRGASAVLNFLATERTDHIKAAIIECPFDAIDQIIYYQLKAYSAHWVPLLKPGLHKLIQKAVFPHYNPQGIQPIDLVDKIDKNIVLVFVHSPDDNFVWVNSSRALYWKAKKAGLNVYLIELPTGAHARCLSGIEGRYYRAAIHALYKHLGLPHNPEYSTQGEPILKQAQPSAEEVESRIKNFSSSFSYV
jgi:hypothetical protein